MRIAILSLRLHTNYGGILQSYALQTVLERLGHQTELLQPVKPDTYFIPYWKVPLSILKRTIKRLKGDNVLIYKTRKKIISEQDEYRKEVNRFVNQYLHVRKINKFSNIKCTDYDAFVVGSDQVWRPQNFLYHWNVNSMQDAFLRFAEDWNVKKIAYAASFGVNKWEISDKDTKLCSSLARKFDYLTVRESDAIDLCRDKLNVGSSRVLDPTMLLTNEDYNRLIDETSTANNGNLFVYILDQSDNSDFVVSEFSKYYGLNPFKISCTDQNETSNVLQPVEVWLKGFKDAEFIITDSFHACVFSILYSKPFIVLGNAERGMSRFDSLLSLFHLEERMLKRKEDWKKISYNVDYSQVKTILDRERENSLMILKML